MIWLQILLDNSAKILYWYIKKVLSINNYTNIASCEVAAGSTYQQFLGPS